MAAEKKPKLKYSVPRTIGGAIDKLHAVRVARKALQAKADAEKEQELLIEALIFERFGKGELEGARGKLAQASIKRSDVPTISDWASFEKHVLRTGELDLFQRRLSVEACRERWSAKRAVPGVEVFTKVSLSVTKR